MSQTEQILAYGGFNEYRSFADWLKRPHRFWEGSFSIIHHVVLTNERVIIVRVSNPFDSMLFGPLLLDGIFYFPRLRWFKDRIIEGKLEKALETNLLKWVYPRSAIASLEYAPDAFSVRFADGKVRTFKMQGSTARITAIGGKFPHDSNFAGAVDAFNKLPTLH